MQYYLYLLAIPFFFINYRIISSDIRYKKIPNRLLGYLLLLVPFYYVYLFSVSGGVNIFLFFGQIILALVISFVLYYFGIWSAGDAKYLLVLAFFVPDIGIIPFVGNIALLTLAYLLLYFLYFYFGKCLFNWRYAKSLYENIYRDLKEKSLVFLKHGDGNFYKNTIFLKLLKWILLFLIFFVSIRLARLYVFASIMDSGYYPQVIEYLRNYTSYVLLVLIGVLIGIVYGVRVLITRIKEILKRKTRIKNNTVIDFAFIALLSVLLVSFIIHEYRINPVELRIYLLRIFTLYIGLYLLFKVLRYSQKVTFQLAEQDFIEIGDLKVGDIVDREYLSKIFGEQKCLGAYGEKGILHPNPAGYLSHMSNPIDDETKKMLSKIYRITNVYHKKQKTLGYSQITTIKVLKTFAFGGYVFAGFLITFFLGNEIFSYIANLIIEYLKNFYN